MNTLTAMTQLMRLYDALDAAFARPASLSRTEEIAEIREAIQIAKGNVASCQRADAALADALTKKGTK